MKKILIATVFITTLIEVLVSGPAVSGTNPSATNPSRRYYYVVVGGFSDQQNAVCYTREVHRMNYPAQYAYNSTTNLYYVYVRYTTNKQQAKELVYGLRSRRAFKDAWLYDGLLMNKAAAEHQLYASRQAEQVKPEGSAQVILAAGSSTAQKEQGLKLELTDKSETTAATGTSSSASAGVGKAFVFKLVNGANGKPVKGNVNLFGNEKNKEQEKLTYTANEAVLVPEPGNKSGRVVIECNIVGYKPVKKAMVYGRPSNGITVNANQEIVVPIELSRIKQREYIDLEHVKFYEKSSILKPESETQLTELVNLMEDPEYKIRLYGHVESDDSGEITTLGHHNTHFFTLDHEHHHRHHASAEKLSHLRAETIKAYLVSKGISARRIMTKGYGAMLDIYEGEHANDRIEMEIVRN